jgi:hypothetical protein
VAIKVNGLDMNEAVLKLEAFEIRIRELNADGLRVNVTESAGEPVNFAPRFMDVQYPNEAPIPARDTGTVFLNTGQSVDLAIRFQERLRIELFVTFQLRYARRKIADITVE